MKCRLLLMGLVCAVLTGLTGGIGILSMRLIHGKLLESTNHIRNSMAEQNQKMNQVISLRSLVQNIADAGNFEDLLVTDEELNRLKKTWMMTGDSHETDVMASVAHLQELKLNHMRARHDLEELKKAHNINLENIRSQALYISDNTEFDSTLAIESALDSITTDFNAMMDSSDRVYSSTKSASNLHSFCYEIDAKIMEAYISEDAAYIAYLLQEIFTLLDNVKNTLDSLPANDSLTAIRNQLDNLRINISSMLEDRVAALNDPSLAADITHKTKNNKARINNIIGMIKTLASQTRDDTEFDVVLALEGATNDIQDNIESMTELMGFEMQTIKNALSVRYVCTQLDVKTREALAEDKRVLLNFLKTEINTLLINAKDVLNRLPENETTTSIAKHIEELVKLNVQLFESKIRSLASSSEFNEVRAELNERMDMIESRMVCLANEVKSNAEETMQDCSAWVIQWQSIEVILVCVAFLLAVVISALVSTSVSKQLQKLYQGFRIAGEGDLEHKVDTGRADEIGDLSRAFDGMTEKLAARENAFKQSEQKFRKLFEVSNDGIIIHEGDKKIIHTNQRLEEMLGFKKDYFAGKRVIDLLSPDERARAEKHPGDSDPARGNQLESRFMKSDGEAIIVDIRSSIIDPEEGIIQSIVRDITQEKRSEEELKAHMKEVSEANRHLEVLVSNTTDREKKMVELKREINDLLVSKGEAPRYKAPDQVDELLSKVAAKDT